MSQGIVQNSLGLYCPSTGKVGLPQGFPYILPPLPPRLDVLSPSTVPWDGRDCPRDSHTSHPQVYPLIPVSCPVPWSHGMDRSVPGILTCPILRYTLKSQCPVPSHSPMGFSHIPLSRRPQVDRCPRRSHSPSLRYISVLSNPPVPWDGHD